MSAGFSKLPDFSKGEDVEQRSPAQFQPLFGPAIASEIVLEDPAQDTNETCDDLAALVSELERLPTQNLEEADDDGAPAGFGEELSFDQAEAPEVLEENNSAALEALKSEHEAALEALKLQHQQELERLQFEHASQVTQQLEAVQYGLVEKLADQLDSLLAASLAPLFQKEVAHSSLEQLLGEIRRIIQTEAVERITLKGPQPLVDAALKALGGGVLKIEVEPSETPDLVVHLNEKILSTCIEDWSRKVDEALGE